MGNPKPIVDRTVVKRGIMEATVYPTAGSVLIKMDSGTGVALKYEEAAALKKLLNEELPDTDPALEGKEAGNQ